VPQAARLNNLRLESRDAIQLRREQVNLEQVIRRANKDFQRFIFNPQMTQINAEIFNI